MAAAARRSRSARGTRSCGTKSDAAQNSTAAPAIRNPVIINGLTMPAARTSFATGAISPHITPALKPAAWPFTLFISILA